jgi:hypothetical protein
MISNQGPIGNDMMTGNGTGFFPSNTANNYVFGTGFWLGAQFDADGDGDIDKVFTQGYNPLAGDSEFREGNNDQSRDDPMTRLFDSTNPDDLSEWPDYFRREVPETGELLPYVISSQDLVTTYTTKDEIPVFGRHQMPIEVRQRSLAFGGGLAGQAIIFVWEIRNWGEEVMRDCWVGYDNDMDVGVAFGDDLVSVIQDRITPEGDTVHVNMGYAWDSDFTEANFTGDPGFVGIAYLRGPGNPTDGVDNDGDGLVDESPDNDIDDDGDGLVDELDEVDGMGLVNFSKHCGPSQPCEVIDPQTDQEGYDMLSCNSPHSQILCMESTTPADVRFMLSSGPFDWWPGQIKHVIMAMVFAHPTGDRDLPFDPTNYPTYRPDPNDDDLVELLAVKGVVQAIVDFDFKSAEPPPAPNLRLIPGDMQVTLLWDDLSLRTPDPDYEAFVEIDPAYREFDFQGYRVWRSRTGDFSRLGNPEDPDYPLTSEAVQQNSDVVGLDLSLLAQYDLADGITTESDGLVCSDSIIIGWNNFEYTDCDTFNLGSDTGLRFSYVDRGDPEWPLTNGFRYYYALTAYDYNSDEIPLSRLSLDSGVSLSVENSVIPRSQASSFIDAFGQIEHVDSTGTTLDDTSSIFISSETGELDPPEVVHASNALVGFTFESVIPEKVSDSFYTLVLDRFEVVDDITNQIYCHVEDASGEKMNTGAESSFHLSYDGTDQATHLPVFDPDDSTVVIFTSDLIFHVDSSAFVIPDPSLHLSAENDAGEDIMDSLGTVEVQDYIPAGYRATDIMIEWVEVGVDTMTLIVTDLDNGVIIPFGEGIVDSTGAEVQEKKGSNWSFLPAILQEGRRYLFTDRAYIRLSLWVSGVEIYILEVQQSPKDGDVWTLRQVAMTMEIDAEVVPFDTTYLDAQRPPVPGTRYRLDTESGGQDKGSVDLTKIRVVPNPYLASAAWDIGPSQRRIEFINLPPECTIRIYTISGVLVRILDHKADEGGTEVYDLLTREGLSLASGNYYYHVTTPDGKTHLGRFAVVQ